MALFAIAGLVAVASASQSLFARNNPPQPPCVYPYTEFVYSGCYVDAVSSRALPFQAELEFNNATVEQCTSYCKGNNYRYAGLEYYGQCFCGTSVSASKAAEEECNLPCNGDSTQACGGADRVSIYQDPTFPDADAIAISDDYMSLGCYTEGESGRSLDYSQWDYLNISAMTTETCLTSCGSKGFPFAGTEFGRECYCGVVLGNGTTATDSDQCSSPCTGNSTQFCGGPDRLSLYVAKNLESIEPCGPPVISSSSSSVPSATSTSYSSTVSPSSSLTLSSSPSLSSSLSSSSLSSSSSPSSSPSSSSISVRTTSSACVGYHCPKTSTVKTSSSSTKKTSSTSCKTTPHVPPKTSTKSTPKSTSTPKPSSSTKKTTTLATTTSCKTTAKSTAKSTVKSTSTKKYGWWE